MSITKEQIAAIGQALLALAAAYKPGSAASIGELLAAATQLNEMLEKIKNQTDETQAAVWDEVKANYCDAVAAFEASRQPQA